MDNDCLDTPRTAREVARRVIALHCIIVVAHGVSREDVTDWLKEEQLWNELTPRELKFITEEEHAREDVIWMTWLVEAQAVLLWAIGYLEELPPPTGKCDTRVVVDAMPGLFESTAPFIEPAVIRDYDELKRHEEIMYDIHVDVDQAHRKGESIPGGYDGNVVFFRHYGLCWVTGYCGQAWDDVTPDT